MIFRTIESDGDWSFGRGIHSYSRDEQAIEFSVRTRLLSWLGDCFFALNEGVDWKSRLDVGQKANLDEELRRMILSSYGVIGINSFNSTLSDDTRAYSATYDIKTFFSASFLGEVSQTIGA